ncbi:MAG: ABC transporter permease subunit [Lachnospiraceae bacterium]|nr:ABC transporter permease subunit [Lachnospiraceae bacterium]
MKTLIKKELKQSRNMLVIWLALVFMLIGFCFFEYLSLKENMGELEKMMGTFPPIMLLMFGVKADLSTALGWYTCLYFWTAILAFAYAIYLGLSCITKETELHTAEYLFTKPASREKIIIAKVIASVCNFIVFSVFYGIFAYMMIILPVGGLEQKGAEVVTVIGLFLTQLVLFSIALAISSLSRKYKSAVKAGTAFLLLSYGISVVIDYSDIHALDFLSPLRYFDAYDLIVEGFRLAYLLLAIAITAFCVWISVIRWKKREL